MADKIICQLNFDGKTPQQAIKYLQDIISRQKQEDKRWLRIEEYQERYGHPFSDGTKEYRLVRLQSQGLAKDTSEH